jgi:hypothetical protein
MLVAILLVAVLGTVALCFLGYQLMDRAPKTFFVQTVDAAGKPIGAPQISFAPAPVHVRANGLGSLKRYVDKLFASSSSIVALLIFTPDGQRGLSLMRKSGKLSLNVALDTRSEIVRERTVRNLFAKRGIKPAQDYLAGNGGVANATRVIDFPLPLDAGKAAGIAESVLREVYEVSSESPLDFTLEEF